jgi:hypothetical protein
MARAAGSGDVNAASQVGSQIDRKYEIPIHKHQAIAIHFGTNIRFHQQQNPKRIPV